MNKINAVKLRDVSFFNKRIFSSIKLPISARKCKRIRGVTYNGAFALYKSTFTLHLHYVAPRRRHVVLK